MVTGFLFRGKRKD